MNILEKELKYLHLNLNRNRTKDFQIVMLFLPFFIYVLFLVLLFSLTQPSRIEKLKGVSTQSLEKFSQ